MSAETLKNSVRRIRRGRMPSMAQERLEQTFPTLDETRKDSHMAAPVEPTPGGGDFCPKCGNCRCGRHVNTWGYCNCAGREEVKTILEEAQAVVFGPRQGVYGHPRDDFQRTAALWTAYLQGKYPGFLGIIEPQDVGALMILLKMARLMESPEHRDSIVDIAGYAQCIARVMNIDP